MRNDDFYDLIKSRRSTRVFKDDPVDDAVVRRIISAAVEAPTACNRQLWHFVVVSDKETKRRISRLSKAQQSYLYDAPILIAVFYDCTLENRNPCKTPYVSAAMAMYAMLLAAEVEGVGAIYLGGIRRPKGVAQAVGAPDYLTNIGVICMGHKDDSPPVPNRRPLNEVLSYNACDLKEKHFHADIRPHLWSLAQLADFREKLSWYKGVHIDGSTLHVNSDVRFSSKFKFMTGRIGMLAQEYDKPVVLDVLPLNGDLLFQIANSRNEHLEKLYAYELTDATLDYLKTNLGRFIDTRQIEGAINTGLEKIDIPLPDGHVDLLTCYERLEQFHDPTPMLREWNRILKPNGRAFVVVSNRFYPHVYRYRRMRKKHYALGRNWNRGPERKYEPKEIRKHFRQAGFKIERETGIQPVQMKVVDVLRKLSERFGAHRLADVLDDRLRRMYTTAGSTRNLSSSIAFEIVKEG